MIEFLAVLGVWKFTVLIQDYDGPLDSIYYLRTQLQKLGSLVNIDCFFCFSTVVAVAPSLYLSNDIMLFFIYWFGLSGGAWLLYNINERIEDGV